MTNTFTIGLLATAVSASLAMANGGEEEKNKFQDKSPVSFKAGSGITFDGGDEFSLNLKNRLQVQYAETFGDDVADTQNFDVRRARTSLSGHAYNKNIHYNIMADWVDGDGSVIKDAWAQWNFVHGDGSTVGIRTGQGKTYHGLEATGTSAGLYFVERSQATKFFADVRSRGAWLHGNHMESKLRWTAGAQNNGVAAGVDGSEEGDNTDNELVYVASANFDLLGDFVGGGGSYEKYMQGDLDNSNELKGTIGAGVAIDNRGNGINPFIDSYRVVTAVAGSPPAPSAFADAEAGMANESTQFNLNTAWKVSGFWAMLDYFNRSDDVTNNEAPGVGTEVGNSEVGSVYDGGTLDHDGWTLTLGYSLPKSGDSDMQWGLGFRASQVNLDENVTDLGVPYDEVKQWGVVLNAFYHGHKCKTQVEFNNVEVGDTESQQILVQFQIII